jgi:hypothetical protein
MNEKTREEVVRCLAKKYFIQQKAEEIGTVFFFIFVGVVTIFVLGVATCEISGYGKVEETGNWCYAENNEDYLSLFATGVLSFFFVGMIVGFSYFVFKMIAYDVWLKSNWEKAKDKAKEKIEEEEISKLVGGEIDKGVNLRKCQKKKKK